MNTADVVLSDRVGTARDMRAPGADAEAHRGYRGGMSGYQNLPLPPLTAAGAYVAQLILPGARKRVGKDGSKKAPLGQGLRRTVAVGLGTAAVGLAAWTVSAYRTKHTTLHPSDPAATDALVTEGANAYTRNPIYVSIAGVLGAHALWRGGVASWLPVAGFVYVVDRMQVNREEAALRDRFGDEYVRYAIKTPRWLGLGERLSKDSHRFVPADVELSH